MTMNADQGGGRAHLEHRSDVVCALHITPCQAGNAVHACMQLGKQHHSPRNNTVLNRRGILWQERHSTFLTVLLQRRCICTRASPSTEAALQQTGCQASWRGAPGASWPAPRPDTSSGDASLAPASRSRIMSLYTLKYGSKAEITGRRQQPGRRQSHASLGLTRPRSTTNGPSNACRLRTVVDVR